MGERRKVLVSGASSGIGKATAVSFAAGLGRLFERPESEGTAAGA